MVGDKGLRKMLRAQQILANYLAQGIAFERELDVICFSYVVVSLSSCDTYKAKGVPKPHNIGVKFRIYMT